ncbi:protein still life, isoform SIF type 1-like isoform X4 [Haliotis rufescens]|uniref:protein still life, isoform SIF type 1-like isoform X4 n=1 Tax=Haliotis rufescens TaxID=6454 RepID=UPI00201F56E9|nr:protein still life, isoform SIF type 1-like isoform X4 [Haliotis rufescens]
MGNKLCAPLLKRSYRNDNYPWNLRKDSHLLRLWADVFRVHGDGEYMRWQRVSDDVVPINITCIEDNPNTIFQITAYNRQVEKIFDVKIIQPGTIICPATECFVHWKDTTSQCEWGLNFQTPTDACRFKDCCSFPTQRFARKASSASSLRLSPPKRIRSKGASASSPSSPVHQRQNPPDGASPSCDYPDGPVSRCSPGRHPIPHTCPTPEREVHHMTSFKPPDDVMDRSGYRYSAMIKPPSENSMYDNVTGSSLQRSSAAQDNRILHRKSLPTCSSATSSPVRSLDEGRPASAISSITLDTSGSPCHSKGQHNVEMFGNGVVIVDHVSIDSPKRDNVHIETAFVGDVGSGSSRPTSSMSQGARLTVDTSAPGASRNTSSSESPEWPSPPEPLTPQTPLTPLYNMEFDSDTIQRMLRSLPASPVEKDDQGFHDDPNFHDGPDHQGSRRMSGLTRTKSLNVHDRNSRLSMRTKPMPEEPIHIPVTKLPEVPKSKQLAKILIEQELLLRNQCAASTYPDSGIGGMAGETSGSLMSEDSGRLAQFKGPGHNHDLHTRSSGGSSGGSRSSTHSDIINQLGEAGDVRQYLTVDISEDDGGESDTGSINTMTESESQLSYGRQVGAIRKAGWLVVKNWLVHKKKKIELAARRNWRRYWMCLKGTTLLFFDCDEGSTVNQNSVPRHILVIEGGIAQAVPEHPKRDFIFSLSTACGDAYLLQASSQNDLENWIRAIHSACASSYARQHGKDNTLKLLKSELLKLDSNVDTDVKMKKMAELQMTVVSDPRSRVAIVKQIAQWEENLEKLYIEQYRFRCYVASLQGTELPNPKVLLANASKATKTTLGRLGIFTVTSFHALVCARKPLILPNIYGKGAQKGGMLSPKTDTLQKPRSRTPTALMGAGVSTEAVFKTGNSERLLSDSMDNLTEKSLCDSSQGTESLSRVMLPNNQSYDFQTMLVGIDKRTTVRDLLESTCNKRQLNPRDHYVRIKPLGAPDNKFLIPDRHACIKSLRYDAIEVCQKCIFQLELTKPSKDGVFGFAVEAELAEDFDRDDELRVYVCDVTGGCVAEKRGLIIGDELLVINGKIVSELDMVYIEMLLHESRTLFLTVRSLRTKPPHSDFITEHANTYIDNMVIPPPPSQPRITDKVIGNLIVPAPARSQNANGKLRSGKAHEGTDQIDALLRGAEQVTAICRNSEPSLRSHSPDSTGSARPMSDAQRMRKVIMELIETERAYVKDLNCLTERYLEPLKEETFLTSDEIDQLFGNIQEIVLFQGQFLHSLEEAIDQEKDFFNTSDSAQFKDTCLARVLFSLGGSFLYYANHFKVYSSFCASHSRSQKIFNLDANEALKNFLRARNPKQQHSATLESYLIKPIQRILKYPLLLQQLCHLTLPDTDEHHHLSEALRGMEAVAEHINEMQKIYEEYGSVFDDLSKTFKEVHPSKKVVDLSVGELQMYGMVEWCNMTDYLGKTKKASDFENTVFVFRTGVVFLCRERLKRRKTRSLPPKMSLLEHHHQMDMLERFRTLIPTQEVQVRVGKVSDIDRHYWWDLIHSRSDSEGRPERLYQFCNSTSEAKSDFMKVIRQTIRESVRSMTVPTKPIQLKPRSLSPCSAEKLDPLPLLNKKRGQDPERHSMDFDEKISALEYEAAFRIRSKTIGDINQASMDDNAAYTTVSEPQIAQNKSPTSSNSNLSSSSQSGSAKLLYASANPLNYSSGSVNSIGSPVWKPRSESRQGTQSPQNQSPKRPGISQDDNTSRNSAISDASNSPKRNNTSSDSPKRRDQKTVVFAAPYGVQPYKDTEC